MMDIVGKRRWFFIIAGLILVPGIISLAAFGLQLGVDFRSGTTMTLRFEPPIDQGQLRLELTGLGYGEAVLQRTGDGDYFIRIKEVTLVEREGLVDSLESKTGARVTMRDSYTVSPIMATETARDAAIAVGIAALFMLLYIAWAFRRMPNPLRWGACAIVAMAHDVLVVMGIFSILGWLAGVQIDTLFITGMLTVVGYSVNNTVVVYDRIRENMSKGLSKDFAVTVNSSILETLGRCLNTSLTTLLVILAIFLFGGATVHYFILVLLIGVAAGIFSSIFISGPLLVVWGRGK